MGCAGRGHSRAGSQAKLLALLCGFWGAAGASAAGTEDRPSLWSREPHRHPSYGTDLWVSPHGVGGGCARRWPVGLLHPRPSAQPFNTHIPHGFGSSCTCRGAKRPPCHSCEVGDREAGWKWGSCLQQTGQHSHGPGMPPTAHVRTTYHDRPVAHIKLGLAGDQGLLVLPDDRGDPAKCVQVLGAGNAAGEGHQVTEVEGGTGQVGQPTQVGQGWRGD